MSMSQQNGGHLYMQSVPTMGPEPPDGNPLPPGNVRARWVASAMSVAYRPDTPATFH